MKTCKKFSNILKWWTFLSDGHTSIPSNNLQIHFKLKSMAHQLLLWRSALVQQSFATPRSFHCILLILIQIIQLNHSPITFLVTCCCGIGITKKWLRVTLLRLNLKWTISWIVEWIVGWMLEQLAWSFFFCWWYCLRSIGCVLGVDF